MAPTCHFLKLQGPSDGTISNDVPNLKVVDRERFVTWDLNNHSADDLHAGESLILWLGTEKYNLTRGKDTSSHMWYRHLDEDPRETSRVVLHIAAVASQVEQVKLAGIRGCEASCGHEVVQLRLYQPDRIFRNVWLHDYCLIGYNCVARCQIGLRKLSWRSIKEGRRRLYFGIWIWG